MNDHIPTSAAAVAVPAHALSSEAEPSTGSRRRSHLAGPVSPGWVFAADRHGFDVIGRMRDKDRLVLCCRACDSPFAVRVSVVRDARPLCHACIRSRRAAAAAQLGAYLVGPTPDDMRVGFLALSCGHVVRRQYQSIERAAEVGFSIDCPTCREARYAEEARAFGWTLDGPAMTGADGYRSYRHGCGHLQDISIGNMLWGDCSCAGCAATWSAKPSFIYMFAVDLPGLPVVKLGHSARPGKRLRHQLDIRFDVQTRILRVLPLVSGHLAQREEKACHRLMHRDHPEMVVPKAVFGPAINTQGEIYHAAAASVIHALMDAVALRHPYRRTSTTQAGPSAALPGQKPGKTGRKPKRPT
ncbi:hypothetical protein SAMN05444339_1083 [Loktanella atrilutea]|uniref:Uncharacterized protein n=1 Tax=Loktanella atrilutea TaxID=366533 RepID=A0A1M5CLQ8_LOKAT|nr:hypothetical protein [Loktanella atrilutea]SHF55527.1 hypothetical protein SAMN05444339_1083 [Loktanella atrilutea]